MRSSCGAPMIVCTPPLQDNATLQRFYDASFDRLDLRSAPRGQSQLAIRRTGEDWRLFPIEFNS